MGNDKHDHISHEKRIEGLKHLKDVLKKTSADYMNTSRMIFMYWSLISCMHHNLLRLRLDTTFIVQNIRK